MSSIGTKNEKLVSVVVPTFNRAYCLSRTIDSVLGQSYRNLELILVDDGSTDDTRKLVNDKYSNEGRLHYIWQENSGVAAARNQGIRHVRGDYVAFLDSDDVWKPWKLELQVNVLESLPDVGMAWTEMTAVDQEGTRIGQRYLTQMYDSYSVFPKDSLFETRTLIGELTPDSAEDISGDCIYTGYIFPQMIHGNMVHTSTAVLRRDRLEMVGGFREDLHKTGEDFDFHLRTCQFGKVCLIDVPTIDYMVGMSDQLTRPELDQYMAANYLKTIEPFLLGDDYDPAKIPEWIKTESLASGYAWYAQKLFDVRKYGEARAMYLASARTRYDARVIAYLVLTMLPAFAVDAIRNTKRWFKEGVQISVST